MNDSYCKLKLFVSIDRSSITFSWNDLGRKMSGNFQRSIFFLRAMPNILFYSNKTNPSSGLLNNGCHRLAYFNTPFTNSAHAQNRKILFMVLPQ